MAPSDNEKAPTEKTVEAFGSYDFPETEEEHSDPSIIIPESFSLMGREYKVTFDKSIMGESVWGLHSERRATIQLYPEDCDVEVNRSMVESTFCHELMHALFVAASEHEYSHNEKLVDQMGKLLHQFMVTARGSL